MLFSNTKIYALALFMAVLPTITSCGSDQGKYGTAQLNDNVVILDQAVRIDIEDKANSQVRLRGNLSGVKTGSIVVSRSTPFAGKIVSIDIDDANDKVVTVEPLGSLSEIFKEADISIQETLGPEDMVIVPEPGVTLTSIDSTEKNTAGLLPKNVAVNSQALTKDLYYQNLVFETTLSDRVKVAGELNFKVDLDLKYRKSAGSILPAYLYCVPKFTVNVKNSVKIQKGLLQEQTFKLPLYKLRIWRTFLVGEIPVPVLFDLSVFLRAKLNAAAEVEFSVGYTTSHAVGVEYYENQTPQLINQSNVSGKFETNVNVNLETRLVLPGVSGTVYVMGLIGPFIELEGFVDGSVGLSYSVGDQQLKKVKDAFAGYELFAGLRLNQIVIARDLWKLPQSVAVKERLAGYPQEEIVALPQVSPFYGTWSGTWKTSDENGTWLMHIDFDGRLQGTSHNNVVNNSVEFSGISDSSAFEFSYNLPDSTGSGTDSGKFVLDSNGHLRSQYQCTIDGRTTYGNYDLVKIK